MNLAVLGDRHVERFGEYPALVFGDVERTNAQQQSRVQALAGALAEMGLRPGDRVAVMMANSLEVGVVYGATLRIGAVVVPLLFLLAVPEIVHILRDAGPRVLFTSPEFMTTIQDAIAQVDDPPEVVVVADHPPYEALLASPPAPMVDRDPGDLAVISYTSGTTGSPKGVMLTHGNLLFQAENGAAASPLEDGDVSLACLPLAHLFGIGNTLVGQLFKIRGVVLDWFTPAGVFDAVRRHRITSTAFVPTMLSLMLADAAFDTVDWSCLRYAVVGAAPLSIEVAREFEERTGARVLQGYGLTETSPAVSLMRLDDPTNGSAGRPLPNVEVQIRADDGSVLPPGTTGEIVVRGPNVMLGYFGRPEETAHAIRDGWFHTGDVGTLDEDGYLHITDRVKDLIIRGGFNVYPSDIEDVLHRHEAVMEAGVIGVPDVTMGEEIAASVVLRPGRTASPDELIEHCRRHLARTKVPRIVQIVDELPKNAVGKVLRRELRQRMVAGPGA